MKRLFSILFLLFIFVSSVHAYVDMSDSFNRAKDLRMTESDYNLSMALTGMLSGTMLGLFLWKSR